MALVSRVVVLGGSGEMGSAVTAVLRGRGHDVLAASRGTGVDATTGAGLDDSLEGADTVVDCLNVVTLSKGTAVCAGSPGRRSTTRPRWRARWHGHGISA